MKKLSAFPARDFCVCARLCVCILVSFVPELFHRAWLMVLWLGPAYVMQAAEVSKHHCDMQYSWVIVVVMKQPSIVIG